MAAAMDRRMLQRVRRTSRAMNNVSGSNESYMPKTTELPAITRWRQDFEAPAAPATRDPQPESQPERISTMGWLSTSIVHDLRNPVGTIYAGAQLLMSSDTTSTQVKRLPANMDPPAGRMRGLL